MPRSIPVMLWYGLPEEAHRASKGARTSSELGFSSDGVGIHSDATLVPSLVEACCRESLMAWCERNSGLKSPRIPIRRALVIGNPFYWELALGEIRFQVRRGSDVVRPTC